MGDEDLNLTDQEIRALFLSERDADRFPPILCIQQAADLLQVPVATVYDWRSRGLLKGCCRKVGKHLRFLRDRLITRIFNEGFPIDE